MSLKKQSHLAVAPYISASQNLPEATLRTFILGSLLAVLMAGANAYLVLKVGMSVSACIPAAVISMAVLKLFKNSNILENNIVQTVASAGEALAGALAMILPALILIGYWQSFSLVLTSSIILIGGGLGVLFTVPLRRAMIVEGELKFPEGVATAEVLKAGDKSSEVGLWDLLTAGIVAAVIKFAQSGWQIVADSINFWTRSGNTVYGAGGGFSLAITGAGYIIGFHASVAIFTGSIIAFYIGIPLYSTIMGVPADASSAYDAAMTIWNTKIRIVGVGAMILGGLWTIVELLPSLKKAIVSAGKAMRNVKERGQDSIPRTDRDIPISWVAGGSALFAVPLYVILDYVLETSHIDIGTSGYIFTGLVLLVISFLLCFFMAAVSSYMCGLMGSSNNPISGTMIMTVIILSFTLMLILGSHINFTVDPEAALSAAAIVILITSIVACAGSLGGDNMQDLKSGQLVGSTPWKQQGMLMVGVIASAIVVAPVFQLLFEAYGIGDIMPREGMDPAKALSSPKAALMAALAKAIFTHTMDWLMIGIGMAVALVTIMVDKMCIAMNSKWRFPVLAIAVGIYLPLDVTFPILLGGLVAWFVDRSIAKQKDASKKSLEKEEANARKNGMLLASGLIAGEAVVGILIAIPFVAYQSTDVFKFVPAFIEPFREQLGLLITALVLYWFYKAATNMKKV
ncbi:OPT family oligopeptide transporter [Candidatus Bealeia paramacronuclearis]|uniref:OPT family oligopeptide transporter n=1 Tax=Candidatus Bealeia paramacronuclearis TaxID=1921001 RepID=A0ABZ2C2Z3_9PROT|nr:OPT family oligopeptide transporter [Candidatus Bealeia paramacronuclearis]